MNQNKNLTGTSKFYFLIQKSGYYLKTSFYEDFKRVYNWESEGDILFSGIVKNSDWVHLKLGQNWVKKRISQLSISKPQKELIWFDIHTIDLKNCNSISKIKIGGYQKPETIELL